MIQFPCPKSISSMTPIEGGYFCNFCKKEIRDLTDLSEVELVKWKEENSTQCVVLNDSTCSTPKFSLSFFALALLLTGGSTLFNFTNAQVESEIQRMNGKQAVAIDSSLGILTVHLKNQYGAPTWGSVWVDLPNGKELELYELEEGVYYVEIPGYCKGKKLVVNAEHLKQKKHTTVSMFQEGEELVVDFKFKARKEFRTISVGSF